MAGAIAALAAYIGNSFIGRAIPGGTRNRGLSVFAAPLLEEVSKTLSAIWLGQPVVLVHLVFGLIEGVYDFTGPSRRGTMAGLLGVTSHLLLGTVTFFLMALTGKWWIGVGVAYLLHAMWNDTIVRVSRKS